MAVLFGIDDALTHPELPGRIGLVTNDAARSASDPNRCSRLALLQAGVKVVRLFTPEHGLHARAADGAGIPDTTDPLTGLPVVSLYGGQMKPSPAQLADLDAVVFDIPDIGARFYTYLWTLSHVLETCAAAKVPLFVLDRPNPLGGDLSAAEGPMLDVEACGSFLGRAPIPIRHALTFGELASFLNEQGRLRASLHVVPCRGWQRAMHWPDTGLPFVPTSPAMPSYTSALFYPGVCLFEATNLSVGRGTAIPFQTVGAPWLRAPEVCREFNALSIGGVRLAPGEFVPADSRYNGERCHCVQLVPTAAKQVRPVAIGLHLLALVKSLHPQAFRWEAYPTAANPAGTHHLERLIGRRDVAEALQDAPPATRTQVAQWTRCGTWAEDVRRHLLYA